MSELDDIKARATERRHDPQYQEVRNVDDRLREAEADLDRAIAIAERSDIAARLALKIYESAEAQAEKARAAALALRNAMIESGKSKVVDAFEPLRKALADTEWLEQHRSSSEVSHNEDG